MKLLKPLAFASLGLSTSITCFAELEEIIVTATKREASVQEIPIAITALSGDQIEKSGVNDLRDLTRISSSFNANSSNSETGGTTLRIRGVGTTGNNIGLESAVGVFVDGVYLSRPGVALADLVDIERIEVLRGPQGTLFGRNTSAGALSVLTQKPDLDEQSFWANATFGNYDSRTFQLGGSVPINDALAFSFSGTKRDQDGYAESETTGADSVTRDRYSMRGQLLWLPNDDMEVRIIADYADADEECCDAAVIRETAIITNFNAFAVAGLPANGGVVASGQDAFQDLETNGEQNENGFEQKGISAQLDWDLGFADFTAIASYRDFESTSLLHSDFVGLDVFQSSGKTEIDTWALEFRLQGSSDRFDWMVGAYYSDEEITAAGPLTLGSDFTQYISASFYHGLITPFTSTGAPFELTPAQAAVLIDSDGDFIPDLSVADLLNPAITPNPAQAFGGGLDATGDFANNRFDQEGRSWSFYTHNTFSVTDKLDIVFGLRWIDEEKDGSFEQIAATSNACINTIFNIGANAAQGGTPLLAAAPGAACFPFAVTVANPLGLSVADSPQPQLFDDTFHDEELTYTAKLVYRIDDNSSGYVSYTHGFKAGGFNLDPTAAIGGKDPRFDSETIDVWEVGYKGDLWDRRLRANLAIFYQEIEDFQVLEFTGVQFVTFNVPTAQSSGMEAEFLLSAVDDLDLSLSLTYTDARYGNNCDDGLAPTPAVSSLCGNDLTNAPHFVGVFGAVYQNIIPGTELAYFINSNVRYETERRTSTQAINAVGAPNPRDIQNSNSKIDLRIGVGEVDGRWTVELWGNNITNKQTRNVTFNIPLRSTASANTESRGAFFDAPRTYGLTLRTEI